MENNQHSIGETNASGSKQESFRNEQPGQQLPAHAATEKNNIETVKHNEQHSESSLPEKDNETLGTP